jgi:hypothetical protein
MSLELNHSNFLKTLNILSECFSILKPPPHIQSKFNHINDNYTLETVDIIYDYYVGRPVAPEYNMLLVSTFNPSVDSCIFWLTRSKNKRVLALLKQINKKVAPIPEANDDICNCGSVMIMDEKSSHYICASCGSGLESHGSVFNDVQLFGQEGNKCKPTRYDPTRHCKFWIERIQALDKIHIPPDVITQITQCIKRDKIFDSRLLLCSHIRVYLKDIKATEFNDHIPLIRKIITGTAPPQLTDTETRKLYNLFDKSINDYNNIKPDDRFNTIYYPYLIYKILDIIIAPSQRKKNILECIHLQSRETLISNDNMWEIMCKHLGLDYHPTDRSE